MNGLSQNDVRGQPEVISKPVKRSGATQTSQNRPQPLPTRSGNPSPTQRVHIRGEDPQPDEERAIPQQAKVEQPIIVKKIEAQLSSSASHSNHQHPSCQYYPKDPIPSPTMPPLEDPDTWHGYSKFDAVEAVLPVEIRAKVTQTFPLPHRRATGPPDTADLALNNTTR